MTWPDLNLALTQDVRQLHRRRVHNRQMTGTSVVTRTGSDSDRLPAHNDRKVR